MQFPVTLSFKKVALSPQLSVTDANGQLLYFVKQKLFKLKEAVTVYGDREQMEKLYTIQADRVIDFSARYHFRDMEGNDIGSIKRHGARSIWKAHYDIYDGDSVVMSIHEEDAMTKFLDALFSEIPIIGIFAGYFFNPTFSVSRPDGAVVVRVKKQPSFFESSFTIEEAEDISETAEIRTVLGILMMTLLERTRG